MHAYLLIQSKVPTKEEIESKLKKKYNISITFSVSSVSEVREFKKSLLFPLQGESLIFLVGLEQAKLETQNALLKVLEEPPHTNLTFVLVCQNESFLLPTILSRLSVLPKEKEEQIAVSDEWLSEIIRISDRQFAIEALENLASSGKLAGDSLEAGVETVGALKKNGSVSLQLTNFLLHVLPQP